MQVLNLVYILLVEIVCSTTALVHYKKLAPGQDGCKTPDGKELKVGETANNPDICGQYVCQSKNGDSLIHYCQRPAPFASCLTDGVSTVTEYPQCCWMCVEYSKCARSDGDTAPGPAPGGDPGPAPGSPSGPAPGPAPAPAPGPAPDPAAGPATAAPPASDAASDPAPAPDADATPAPR